VVLIIAATLLVYWPALRNGFVWDDTALVLRDPLIRSWRLIPEGFHHFLFLDATASAFYRPIQRLSFVFDYQLYGFDHPWGWHLTSILVHLGAALALFFLAEKLCALLAERWAAQARLEVAAVVAFFWAIHPLWTSAVTYVAGRADPLAAFFGFAGLALGVTGLRAPKRSRLIQLGAALALFLAMLSKESGLIFPLLWLLLLIWHKAFRRALIWWLPIVLLLVAAYSALRFTAEQTPPPVPPPTPAAIRPILAARAFAGYAGLLVAPIHLRMERDIGTRPLDTPEATLRQARALEFLTLAGVLLGIGFAGWLWYCFRRETAAAGCLVAFVVAYLPISNLLPLNATIAEHWLYVPAAFLFLALAITVQGILLRRNHPMPVSMKFATGAALSAWALLLGIRGIHRQADWRDQRTFIERTIAEGGDSARMLMNLGNVELAEGNKDEAIALYRVALHRSPDQPVIWMGYAGVLMRLRKFPEARQALAHAENSPLLAADALLLRAGIENAGSGQDPEALLRQAIELAPRNWGIRKKYIEYLHDSGRPQEALRELQGFLKNYSFRAESWKMLGQMFEEQHQPALAVEAYREAAARDVRDAESRSKIAAIGSH
jgi:tetratricopeptide (TPR) repeat protein